jgi:hypothetical protein
MRATFQVAVMASMLVVGLACSSVLDKEVARVTRATCSTGAPYLSSQTKSDTGRITAAWSCPAPTDWNSYLEALDSSLKGYQRKSSTADGATYSRHEPGDSYVLQLTLVQGAVPRLDGKLTVGPD